MERQEAEKLVKDRLGGGNLFKHTLAVEAVMCRLARHLGEDEEKWGLTGLLHDIDYAETADDPERHSMVGADMLEEMGLEEDVVEAVRSHNDRHGLPRRTTMAKALYCSDPVTGLIVAGALVHPDKRLASLDTEFLLNRFHEKSFARGARRDTIEACSDLGLELEEFLGLALDGMQEVSDRLGL